jgi:hypothetical protein
MLAAAEGRTDDTRGKSDPEVAMARAARLGLWGAIAALVFSAAATILPGTDALFAMTGAKLLAQAAGAARRRGHRPRGPARARHDGTVSIDPIQGRLRPRPARLFYFSNGESTLLLAAAAGSVGLYLCTIVLSSFRRWSRSRPPAGAWDSWPGRSSPGNLVSPDAKPSAQARTWLADIRARLAHVYQRDIWRSSSLKERTPKAIGYAVLRVVSISITVFIESRIATRAAALSFSSLLGLGPLLVIAVLVAGFALGQNNDPDLVAKSLNKIITTLAPQLT